MPTVALSPVFNWQNFTIGGLPLSSGLLYTYLAGTSTPAAVYTTSAGNVAHSNPIVLGPDGRASSEIWLVVGTAYNLVLKDSLGSLVPPNFDNIVGFEGAGTTDTLRADLASSAVGKGSKLVRFIQRLGSAVPQWVEDVLSEWVTVTNFGAYNDGTHISETTAAIAAAWAGAQTRGARLEFPAGTYAVSSLPNFAVFRARVVGRGRVDINYSGAGIGMDVDGGDSTSVVSDVDIRNLTINCTGAGTIGVRFRGLNHSTAKKIRSLNFPTRGFQTNGIVSCLFENLMCTANEPGQTTQTAIGLYCDVNGGGIQTSNCTWINLCMEGQSTAGIWLQEAIANTLLGGTSEGHTGSGEGLHVAIGSNDNSITGMDFESNGGNDITLLGERTVFNSIFSDGDISITGNGTAFRAGQLNNLTINSAADGTVLDSLSYTGTIVDNGTGTARYSVFQIGGGMVERDLPPYSIQTTASCPNATPTTGVTLPSTGAQNYMVSVIAVGAGASTDYNAYAIIAQNLASSDIRTQEDGALLAITLVGQVVKVEQTSGAGPINVLVRAIPM